MSETTDLTQSPDYLYFKFRAINDRLVESLASSSLYFAQPATLNDPFDCRLDLPASFRRAANSSTGRRKKWLRSALDNPLFHTQFEKKLAEVGVCSFSLYLDKPLSASVLWSHYADEHRGVCLLYRFPAAFIDDPNNEILGVTKLNYGKDVLTDWLMDSPMEFKEFLEELTKAFLTAKSGAWQYENEARMIRHRHGLFSIPLGSLEQVCFGLLTPRADIDRVEKLAREHCGCKKFARIVRDKDSDFGLTAVEM